MKKLVFCAAGFMMAFPVFPAAADSKPADYHFLAECAAIYSVKAVDTQGKVPPDYTDSYYAAAADFYKIALAGGGEEMKAVYNDKLAAFKNVAANDAVGKQYKRALEKQCYAAAAEHKIRIKH